MLDNHVVNAQVCFLDAVIVFKTRFCANVCAGPPADETTRTEATTGTYNDQQS